MRAHIVISDELLKKVDSLVGKRKRSRFVEDVIRERLKREALIEALKDTAGSLSGEGPKEWDTTEKGARWVRNIRREDSRRTRTRG